MAIFSIIYQMVVFIVIISVVILFWASLMRLQVFLQLQKFKGQIKKHRVIGFFHPFCNSGGGGEKVLF